MSAADELLPIEPTNPSTTARIWNGFEQLLDRVGDHLNPILIKEARQALKSRQFMLTFALVLAGSWGWSLLGLALIGPRAYYAAEGADMLCIYYLILAFALLIVVPYGAFRSLAGELEDHTYELLSITTLKARQIIGGKLATSVLQMLVYLSAIAPCIAFTYLLRGVDIMTIVMLVFYTCLASLAFALLSLLLATCAMEKYRQVVASVMLVLALGCAFVFACAVAGEIISSSSPFNDRDFLIINGMLLTTYLSYFVLLYLAAAAQLSFASSNRSTAVRIVMVVQQVLLCVWIAYLWLIEHRDPAAFMALIFCSLIHWYAMGMFLTGEPSQLSPRVKRDLPQSFFGRAFLTWFNPGPGTGYMLALCGMLAVVMMSLVMVALFLPLPLRTARPFTQERTFYLGIAALSYLAIYLGIGKLLLSALSRFTHVRVILRMMIHLVLVAFGTAIPVSIQFSSESLRNSGYTLVQISNPFWSLAEMAEKPTITGEMQFLAIVLPIAALLVVLANLPSVVAEVRQVRIALPERVAEEDAELAPLLQAQPARTSPWD